MIGKQGAAPAGINDAGLRKAAGERCSFGQAGGAIFESDGMAGLAEFVFDRAAQNNDAGGRVNIGGRLRKAIFQRPHEPDTDGELADQQEGNKQCLRRFSV